VIDDSCCTRDWQFERYADNQFAIRVPQVAWDFLAQRVQPVVDHDAARIWDALFAGVGRPFHFTQARGWMGKVFRRVQSQPHDLRAGQDVETALSAALVPSPAATIFLVHASRDVFAVRGPDLLDCWRRNWLPLDDAVVASTITRRVVLYWEGSGPYFADRGRRDLLFQRS